MKNRLFSAVFFFTGFLLFAQDFSAKRISEDAVKKENPQEAIDYISSVVGEVSDPAEKRSLYIFLGNLQESMAFYTEAGTSFVTAAGIAAGDASGMPKRSSERLVIDAARCALCSGEGELALRYLNSAVRNSKSDDIQALIKLYEQWAALVNAESLSDVKEPVSMLKAYVSLDSMKSVKPSVLLTLWYVTGEEEFSDLITSEFPFSPEAGIVCGKVQVMPSPFWFFVPRQKIADTVVAGRKDIDGIKGMAKPDMTGIEPLSDGNSGKSEGEVHKPVKQQLGLFRDKENADAFVKRLVEKKFSGYVQEERRSSGTVYYVVLVDDTDGEMGIKLKSAGFECYPVY